MPVIGEVSAALSAVLVSQSDLDQRFGKLQPNDAAVSLACERALSDEWPNALGEVARTALALAQQPKRRALASEVIARGLRYSLDHCVEPPRELIEAALLLLEPKYLRGRRLLVDKREKVLAHHRADPRASQREIARRAGIAESTLRSWLGDPVFRSAYGNPVHAQQSIIAARQQTRLP